MKTISFFLLLFLAFSINGNAQLLDKLKQKAETVVDKAMSSTAQDTKTDDKDGHVLRRANADIYLLYKDKDGTCHIASLTLKESYAGGGTHGSPYLRGLWDLFN